MNILNGKLYILLVIFLSFISLSCGLENKTKWAENMGKGGEKYIANDHEQAEMYYKKALAIAEAENNSNNILTTLGDLGRTYSAADKNAEAEETFKRRIDLATENNMDSKILQETHYALTLHFLTKSKCQEAKDSYEKLKAIKGFEQDKESQETLEGMFKLKNCT